MNELDIGTYKVHMYLHYIYIFSLQKNIYVYFCVESCFSNLKKIGLISKGVTL